MKKLFFVLSIGMILSACSSESTPVAAEEKTEVAKASVEANQLLTMEIDGMVCQMGCGGSIRKGLKSTNGVATVEFDFEEERKTNVAKIAYDKSIVSSEELVSVVSKLNDGQFLVGSVSFTDFQATPKVNEKTSSNHASNGKVNVSSSTLKFPNLLDLFSSILK